jgi:predicted RNA-binding protein with PIN domain
VQAVLLVDAENVRRSLWPNMPKRELVERTRAWAAARGLRAVLVFDAPGDERELEDGTLVVGAGGESADDWIAREAERLRAAGHPFHLVTSDRALRAEAGRGAERVVGGGSFARELQSSAFGAVDPEA